MITPSEADPVDTPLDLNERPHGAPEAYRGFFIATSILVLGFVPTFIELVRFSLESDFHSYILLVPFISMYLVWMKRPGIRGGSAPDRKMAFGLGLSGLGLWSAYFIPRLIGIGYPQADSLAIRVISFVLLLGGICHWFVGKATVRLFYFPLVFLAFMAPFPEFFSRWMETASQHGSATVAHAFFKLAGTPVFREGMFFQLPGFRLQVAPECSGIHSTIALCLTSLVAGHLFLRSTGNRVLLVAAIFPLALLRNGFRVFTIGELCVHVSPDMIDSPIHHHGGPLFFLLSLVPFSALLFWLVRSEKFAAQKSRPSTGNLP